MLYGVSKSITEHINLGDRYDQVRKVYSISFDTAIEDGKEIGFAKGLAAEEIQKIIG